MSVERLVLGLETSCDETAAAVVRGGYEVRASVVASQDDLHAEYRGVVPEIAGRAHAERVLPVARAAVERAGVELGDIEAVAVGHRPGLIGCLLVGVSAAKALAWGLGVPLVGVDHVRAHLHAGLMRLPGETEAGRGAAEFPALGLVISGGHTSLYRLDSATGITRIGGTIDDAVGEAYDKVATLLGVPFPGGPRVDALAQAGEARWALPVSRLGAGSLDFSFSGLKTAVRYLVQGVPGSGEAAVPLDDGRRRDLAASFQRAAVSALTLKLERALEAHRDVRTLLVGGGVSANSWVRSELTRLAGERGLSLRLPALALCVDNAAMIAGLGHELLASRGWRGDGLDLTATPTTAS